jgi:predicted PurR-regulated permease PerM
MPTFIVETRDWLEDLLYNFNISQDVIPEISIDWNGAIEAIKTWFNDSYSVIFNDAVSTTTSIFGGVFDGIFSLMISVYVLAQKEKIGRFMKRVINSFFPEKCADVIHHICAQTYFSFTRFIGGQLTEAIILGVLCYIGMLIFGFPYPLVVSVLVGVTAIVPILGAWLGGGIAALLILIYDPVKALSFIVYFLILQQIEGNLIYPRVVGSQVGLPGVWVLLAIIIGSNVIGPVGALVAVPLASVIYVLLAEFVKKREQRNEL